MSDENISEAQISEKSEENISDTENLEAKVVTSKNKAEDNLASETQKPIISETPVETEAQISEINTEENVTELQTSEESEISEVKMEPEQTESKISRSFTNNFVEISDIQKPEKSENTSEIQKSENVESQNSRENEPELSRCFTNNFSDQETKKPENSDVIKKSADVIEPETSDRSRKFTNNFQDQNFTDNFAQSEATTRDVSEMTSYVTCDDIITDSTARSDVTTNYDVTNDDESSTETVVSPLKSESPELSERENPASESPIRENPVSDNSGSYKTAYSSCELNFLN